ncbi:MAG TPA: DUF6603 domain-containing protein [Kofleriaceae bacterium]|nr:DUF6603 domain-containing protein [Kofleriaceae bacterium]
MNVSATVATIVREIGLALRPLERAVASREAFASFMARLGWRLETLPAPIHELLTPASELAAAVAALDVDEPSPAAVASAIQSLVAVVDRVRAIAQAPDAAFDPHLVADDFKNRFAPELLEYLLATYLRDHRRGFASALGALGVMSRRYQPAAGNRRAYVRRSFRPRAIVEVLEDPAVVLQSAYGWGTDDPDFAALFDQLDDLFLSLGVHVEDQELEKGVVEGVEPPLAVGAEPRSALDLLFFEHARATGILSAGVKIAPLGPDGASKPGLALLPYFNGVLGLAMDFGPGLKVTLDSDLDAEGGIGIVLRPDEPIGVVVGFAGGGAPTGAEGSVTVRVEVDPGGTEPTVLLGKAGESRLELVSASMTAGLRVSAGGSPDLYAEFALAGGKLAIAAGEGDSFLQAILPEGGIAAAFDLTVGLSTERGFYFGGAAGLSVTRAVSVDLGPVQVTAVHVEARPVDGGLPIRVTADASATLGPVQVVASHIGLKLDLGFPEAGGNLGVVDLEAGFQPPSGLGVVVAAGPVTGGGYLDHDPALGRYSGALQLTAFEWGLRAVGLLDTRLPGGVPAYSFVAFIAADIPPIPLPFGFRLVEVGGLIGIHRTANLEALRGLLREGRLDDLLFSEDPVVDAPRIVADLATAFPAAADRFVVGPMATVVWGAGGQLEAKLAVILELPFPLRLLLVGTIDLMLPHREAALIDVHLDVVGEIDLGRVRIALDGRLRDSTVVGLSIEGEMGFRFAWGDDPVLALSIGGFHPDFRPPPGFPKLQPITIPLGMDDNPRITLTGYLAQTANTIQVGAAADLYASAGWFNITGTVSFNALFRFLPFSFKTDFSARVMLRKGSTDLAGVTLDAAISGPSPWHVAGEACLVLKWLPDPCVGIDETFGTPRLTDLLRLDPWNILRAAIETVENYTAALAAAAAHGGATFARGVTAFDPGAGVTFRQGAVPLHRLLTRFGEAAPLGGPTSFAVETVEVGGNGASWTPATDRFAPAQFEEMSDADKLSRPSFEKMDAGVTVARDDVRAGAALARELVYETRLIDSAFPGGPAPEHRPELVAVEAALALGATATSPLRARGARGYQVFGGAPLVALAGELFAVSSAVDLTARADIAAPGEKGAVIAALARHLALHPEDADRLQVVPVHELREAA